MVTPWESTICMLSKLGARHPWLMPIILATQEAEIRRITVLSQAWANSSQDPISKKPIIKKGVVEWLKQWSACQARLRP
jgi:hypothetical protein